MTILIQGLLFRKPTILRIKIHISFCLLEAKGADRKEARKTKHRPKGLGFRDSSNPSAHQCQWKAETPGQAG